MNLATYNQNKTSKLLKLMLNFCLFCFSISFSIVQSSENPNFDEKLTELFEKEWQSRLKDNPVSANSYGDMSEPSALMDVSEKAYLVRLKSNRIFLTELKAIPYKKLTPENRINYDIFEKQISYNINQIEFKTYEIPFLAESGFHTSMTWFPKQTKFTNLDSYNYYLDRLENIPQFFNQNITNMNSGLKRRYSMPAVVMLGFTEVIHQIGNKKVEESEFWQPFVKLPKHFTSRDAKNLKKRAKKVIGKTLLPAYQSLAKYFENQYIPNTKQSLGAYDFPNGAKYYQSEIAHYTTTNMTAEQIHELGLIEVARIKAEMDEIIKRVKFKGGFKAFLKFLRESPQFYAKTPEELLKEASYIAKKMDGQLPRFFTKLPRQPYTVEAVPEAIAPKYTTGRYVSAPLDSDRPGTYWVNTYALDKRPLYVLESLTLHEAVPGHHLQGALNQELSNLPNFRRYSYISAFGEGWALYCEKLGLEAGFYKDPYSDFGRLSYEMWRAARLVIDTGIHAMGWTRERAIKLLSENSALSIHNITTEIDRYISWPGQALSYKIGELKILELRKKAELELGEKFDIRHFHDAILANGSIPLDVLSKQMNDFIDKVKND
ncbi:MAG: DUF885 domain-containing protein [Kangiella sp.]|nr:MAG: DUF885 domain-containing protein [Kangiella sp.]PHS19899.1 MAG: DUF885 domain-containing protein [Kangiella sp.]